jgi:hypothetical protein
MGNRARVHLKKLLGWFIVAALIVWPSYQIVNSLRSASEKHDASNLLYQVALFQMELLNSALIEGAEAKRSEELNELRLAAYSANFTHERLVLAEGKSLSALHSLPELIQYLLRLQIGGERNLKQDETDTFAKAGAGFKVLFDNYSKLMSSGGKVVGSANDKMKKADDELYDLIHKKLQP